MEPRCLLTIGVPQIFAPVDVTDGFPDIEWIAAQDATEYEIHINNLSTGQNRVIRQRGISDLEFSPQNEQPTSNYRVWVRAHNDSEVGFWSQPFDFSVESDIHPLPSMVSHVSLTDDNGHLRLSWDAAPWAETYEIEIQSASGTIGQIVRASDIHGTSYDFPDPLPPGQYVAWVRAHNATGSGPWNSPTSGTIGGDISVPAVPELTVQGTFLSDEPLVILRSIYTTPAFLDLQINDISGHPVRVLDLDTRVGNRVSIDEGLPTGQYRLWGRLVNEMGVSAWSDPVDFEVSEPTVLPLPSMATLAQLENNITETRPLLQWTPDDHAARFELWINVTTKDHDGPWYYNSSISENQLRVPTGFEPGESYRVWVRAFNHENLPGEWSQPMDFSVSDTIPLPSRPELNSPAADVLTPQPLLRWQPAESAESYQLWLSDLTLGHRILLTDDLSGESWLPESDLITGHQYRYWVRAKNYNDQFGHWSDGGTFSVREREISQQLTFGSGFPDPKVILPDPMTENQAFVLSGTGESGGISYLARIHLQTFELLSERLPVGNNGAALEYIDGYVVVAARGSGRLVVVDPASWTVVSDNVEMTEPATLDILPNGDLIAGSLFDRPLVMRMEAGHLQVGRQLEGSYFPYDLTVDEDRNLIFLNGYTEQLVHVLDATTFEHVADVDVEGSPSYGGTIWRQFYVATGKEGYLHLIDRETFEYQAVDLAELMDLDRSTLPEAGIDPNNVIALDDLHLFVVQGRQESIVLAFDTVTSTFELAARGPGATEGMRREDGKGVLLWNRFNFHDLAFNATTHQLTVTNTVAAGDLIVQAEFRSANSNATIVIISSNAQFSSVNTTSLGVTEVVLPVDFEAGLYSLQSAGQSDGYVVVRKTEELYLGKLSPSGIFEFVKPFQLQAPFSLAASDKTLAVTDRINGEIEFIERDTGESRLVVLDRYRPRSGVFTPSGEFVVVHDTNPDVGVSVISGNTVKFYPQLYTRWLSEIEVVDNDRVALLGYNGSIRIFNVRTGIVERTYTLPFDRPTDFRIVQGHFVVASPSHGKVVVVEMSSGKITEIWQTPSVTSLISDGSSVWVVDPFNITQRQVG
jgi:hypothetical protein